MRAKVITYRHNIYIYTDIYICGSSITHIDDKASYIVQKLRHNFLQTVHLNV